VGFKSSSPNYTLITTIGDGLGGTAVAGVSKRASSAKHIYIPGVVAAASP